jgi:hypothetical protein
MDHFVSSPSTVNCTLCYGPNLQDRSIVGFYKCSACDCELCLACILYRNVPSSFRKGGEALRKIEKSYVASVSELSIPTSPAAGRFQIIQTLNRALVTALPLIDLTSSLEEEEGISSHLCVARLLSLCKGVLFEGLKMPIWEAALRYK